MKETIELALEALSVAKDCGGELDLDFYADAHKRLQSAVLAIREHDTRLNDAGRSPEGSDYEFVMQVLGLVPQPTVATPPGPPAKEVAQLCISADKSLRVAALLGVRGDAELEAVEVTVEVVDPTQDFIGGEDIDKARAIVNLRTGHLDLVDAGLGHPILCTDGAATIYHRGRAFNAAVVDCSIPESMQPEEIPAHVRVHGNRGLIDLEGIREVAGKGAL
jgi:hypothetical protein